MHRCSLIEIIVSKEAQKMVIKRQVVTVQQLQALQFTEILPGALKIIHLDLRPIYTRHE